MIRVKIKYFAQILIIFIIAISCKTQKPVAETKLDSLSPEFLFSKLKENETKYVDLAIRFDAEIELDKKKNSVKGNLRMKKDSIIWVSITPLLGIEAFRVVFTQDSVKMINKLNSTYFLGNYSIINKMFNTPFDFEMMQALVSGNDFTFYETDVFKAQMDSRNYKLSTPGRKRLKKHVRSNTENDIVLIQDIWLDPVNYKIVKQKWKEIKKENTKLEIEYSNFQALEDNQLFPHSLSCQVSAENNVSLKLNYTRVQLNRPFEFTFVIPDKYKPFQF